MASLATAVDHVECAHDLEAGVRELRLLAAHAPPYNRRSKFPHRWWWLVLTDEAFPRFSAVRAPQSGTAVRAPQSSTAVRRHDFDWAVGPFRSRADAVQTAALLARFTGVRTCTARLGRSALHGPRAPNAKSRRARRRATSRRRLRRCAVARQGPDRGRRQPCTGRRAVAHHRPGRARPLRDRGPAAGPHRRRDRGAVARPTAACAGRRSARWSRPSGRRTAAGIWR